VLLLIFRDQVVHAIPSVRHQTGGRVGIGDLVLQCDPVLLELLLAQAMAEGDHAVAVIGHRLQKRRLRGHVEGPTRMDECTSDD
jgi:hypothetical protein